MDNIKAWLKKNGIESYYVLGLSVLDLALLTIPAEGEAVLSRKYSSQSKAINQNSNFIIKNKVISTGKIGKKLDKPSQYDGIDSYIVDLKPYKTLEEFPVDEDGLLAIPSFIQELQSGKHPFSFLLKPDGTPQNNIIINFYNLISSYALNPLSSENKEIVPSLTEHGSQFKFRFRPVLKTTQLLITDTEWYQNIVHNLEVLNQILPYSRSRDYLAALWNYPEYVKTSTASAETEYNKKHQFSLEELYKAVETSHYKQRSGFNADRASYIEVNTPVEEIEKMKEQVLHHCRFIPNLEIKDLRKISLVYNSDGDFANTADAVNHPKTKRDIVWSAKEGYHVVPVNKDLGPQWARPVIYVGEAWRIYFTIGGVDYLQNNFVNFVTPEQFLDCYTKLRPDLIEEGWKPWSDLIFISTDWCERNGARVKQTTGAIDLQSPHQKRIALWQWIIGPLAGKCLQNGKPITSLGLQVVNGADHSSRLKKMIY